MRRYLPFVIVAVAAVSTFGGGFALYRAKKLNAPSAPTSSTTPATGIHIRGPKTAAVTIEEFGDFQCPPCSGMAALLKKEEEEKGSRLRVIFHHFPLVNHIHAKAAAHASEAAHEQGKFWEMHDLLYKEQPVWSKAEQAETLFEGYATSLGLDMERYKKDVQHPSIRDRVDADQKLGTSRGVTSTPTLFINGVALPPDQTNPNGVHKAIEAALQEKPKQ